MVRLAGFSLGYFVAMAVLWIIGKLLFGNEFKPWE
jgi:hypothetical protein